MTEQVRYKMPENGPTVYLFPDDKGVIIEKQKGGCPFGYKSGSPLEEDKSHILIQLIN